MEHNFTEYMMSFYGNQPNAIYDYKFTREQINLATQLYQSYCFNYMGRIP